MNTTMGVGFSAESARGISPRAAHRTGREPLDSSGSCRSLKTGVFRRHRWAPPASRWPVATDASDLPPLLRGRYPASPLLRGSPPLTGASVFQPHGSATCAFSLHITSQVLKFRALA